MRHPTLCILIAAVAASACRRHPPAQATADAGAVMWTAQSSTGKQVVRQRGDGHHCTLESTGAREWTLAMETCIATPEQLVFLAEDGEHLLVIDPMPQVLGGEWEKVPVIWLYEEGSLRIQPVKAGEMIRNPKLVNHYVGTVGWLRGTGDMEGPPPGYADNGAAVDIVTADGVRYSLPFDYKKYGMDIQSWIENNESHSRKYLKIRP